MTEIFITFCLGYPGQRTKCFWRQVPLEWHDVRLQGTGKPYGPLNAEPMLVERLYDSMRLLRISAFVEENRYLGYSYHLFCVLEIPAYLCRKKMIGAP